MSDPDAPELSTREILLTLVEHGVEYVLVGGVAEVARGSPRMTMDVDITPRWRRGNLERLAGALRAMAALLRVEGDSGQRLLVRFPISGEGLASFELSTWRTVHGGLDVVSGIPTLDRSLADYDDLIRRSDRFEAFGITVEVASLDDLIEAKETLGRPRDGFALFELKKLRDRVSDEG